MKRICLFLICTLFFLCACGKIDSRETLWAKAVSSIKIAESKHDSEEETSGYKSARDRFNKSFNRTIKKLTDWGVTLDNEFVSDYLQVKTIDDLNNDYNTFAQSEYAIYNPDFLSKNTIEWINRITVDYWNSLQNYYNVKPRTIYDTITANTGLYYYEHPDAEPHESSKRVEAVTYIDDNGKEYYETKEDTVQVTYYGDFAIANITSWRFGGGNLGWRNGEFIDIADKWICEKEEKYYYKGTYLYTSDEDSDIKNQPILFIDGTIYRYDNDDLFGINRILIRQP